MKVHFLLCIVLLACLCVYIYQFHEDKYHSAVSYVVDSANSLKNQVGSRIGVIDGPKITLPANTVLKDIVSDVMEGNKDGTSNEDSQQDDSSSEDKQEDDISSLPAKHSNQLEWGRRRAMNCEAAKKVSWSSYGLDLKEIALPFFMKYDSNLKFIYCSIPKVASTNWKRTMIVLSMKPEQRSKMTRQKVNELVNVHNDPRIQPLNNAHGNPFYPPFSKYYKFVIFRHPFTRAVSAWRNKLQLVNGVVNKYFYINYGIDIIKITRGEVGVRDWSKNQKKNMVTFQEFVIGIRHGIVDRHWMPQSEICQPCSVNYNHVGFFEYLNEDTNYILDQIGVEDEVVKADKVSSASQKKSTTDITRELFNELSEDDRNAMYLFYKKDFLLFGYDKDVNSETFPYPNVPLQ